MNLELEQKFKVEMKAGKIDRACQRYDLGRNTMRRIAEAAGAVIRMRNMQQESQRKPIPLLSGKSLVIR